MLKKLFRHDDNLAIIIDKSILESLNITEETELNLRTDGVNIILEPIRTQTNTKVISDNPKLQKIYEDILAKYDDILNKLT